MTREPERTRSGRGREGARLIPHNLEAEESLLGAALLADGALEVLATRTKPGDYYKPAHGHIAHVLTRAYSEGWTVDPVTVDDELRRQGLSEQVGGLPALLALESRTPATSNAGRYARIITDHRILRDLLAKAGDIAELGYDLPEDVGAAVARAQSMIADVGAGALAAGNGSYSTLEIPDVAALLEGPLEAQEGDFLTRNDGRALFYAGKMHALQGEPSSGKSWLALLAACEVLAMGGAVIYLDYEDSSRGILGRLLALGAEPDAIRARFAYVQPLGAFGLTERVELEKLLKRLNPDLIVIDGVAEALTRDGASEDRAGEVVAWIERLPRWLARTGAAVVMLDHVAKDREQQGRWARGSGAKLGAVDGATYVVRLSTPFSRHREGKLKIIVAKDRLGGSAIGEVAAVAYVEPKADGERVVIRLEADKGERSAGDTWKPTVLMRRVSEELERSSTPLTASAVKNLVHSDKPKLVTEAIARLMQEGYVLEVKHGRSKILRSVRPYGSESDEEPPEARDTSDAALFDDWPGEGPDNVTRGPWPAQPEGDDPE